MDASKQKAVMSLDCVYIYINKYAVDTYNKYVYLCVRLRFLSGNKVDIIAPLGLSLMRHSSTGAW